MLYSRFLASLLAKHKRDGAARGRMPQQGPPTQQPQASSSAPVYQQQQQQRPTTQQAPPSHSGASPSSFTTGGNPTTVQDVPERLHSEQRVSQTHEFKDTAKINEPTQPLEPLPYQFGSNAAPPSSAMDMDFTFDSIAIDELLGPMKAIDNPLWMQTMMLPGYVLACLKILGSAYLIVCSADFRGRRTRVIHTLATTWTPVVTNTIWLPNLPRCTSAEGASPKGAIRSLYDDHDTRPRFFSHARIILDLVVPHASLCPSLIFFLLSFAMTTLRQSSAMYHIIF